MTNIKTYNSFNEFLSFNESEILGDYYTHFHFLKALNRINSKELELVDFFNVIGSDSKSIICIWTDSTYYIYGKDWDQEMISIAVEKIELHKFKNYTFLGNRNIIDEIFKTANLEIYSRKNRIVYICSKVTPLAYKVEGDVENAPREYINQLINLGTQYYKEEFEGQGTKTDEMVADGINSSVENGTIYSLRTNDIIHSIVTVISYDRDKPMIGSLYTKPESRNKGYAYKLLHKVTEGLLNSGFKDCGLLSNADNPSSNRIFNKIGYIPISDLVVAFKKERI